MSVLPGGYLDMSGFGWFIVLFLSVVAIASLTEEHMTHTAQEDRDKRYIECLRTAPVAIVDKCDALRSRK